MQAASSRQVIFHIRSYLPSRRLRVQARWPEAAGRLQRFSPRYAAMWELHIREKAAGGADKIKTFNHGNIATGE